MVQEEGHFSELSVDGSPKKTASVEVKFTAAAAGCHEHLFCASCREVRCHGTCAVFNLLFLVASQ
jgi:hypothetical protein